MIDRALALDESHDRRDSRLTSYEMSRAGEWNPAQVEKAF